MNYLGIDVHKRDSYIAVLNDDGAVVEEVRFANADLDDFAQAYPNAKAVIEATGNYYTIYDTLDQYMDVFVADPGQTKAIGYAEVKNDRLDAMLLAQLRRADMLATSYVPSDEIRERRTLVRGRKRLVEKRTDFKNEVHALSLNTGSRTTGTRSVRRAERSSPARISRSIMLEKHSWSRFLP